ncbi:hypothetical protein ATE48_03205 [Candidatus Viadribacter manganicus]|uniref:Uncharacterized protein n=2 Tax=Candidatus Viadribacter manganicus TaxID=1759059 RepID=A0A1B1AEM3_9PROT|nr:hypothetical protein ATE48_03205 [Candidatus Viadribacter manganicus]
MIVFCTGAGLCALAYFLGVGALIGALISGGDPALVVGGIFAAIALGLTTVVGFVLMLIGGIWMIGQVIADQSGGAEEKRYRDVER